MKLVGLILGVIVVVFVATLVVSSLFMVLLGAAHSYNSTIPALGFAESFFVVLALRLATQSLPSKSS